MKDLEDDPEGIGYLKTHSHNPPLTIGGVDIARTVEVLPPYTVTFEDGQYRVIIKFSNNNVLDVTNVNQVSVSSTNSAGLVTSAGIEAIEYNRRVTIDITSSNSGSVYPVGTPRFPVNNVADAQIIATARGFLVCEILGNITFGVSDNIDNYKIIGDHPTKTLVTLITGVSTIRTEFEKCSLTGDALGAIAVKDCHLQDIDLFGSTSYQTSFHNCVFEDTAIYIINSITTKTIYIIDCQSAKMAHGGIVFDMNGNVADFDVNNWTGGIEIRGMTNVNQNVNIDMNQGHVIIDSSCVAGTITVHGLTVVTDNSNGATVDITGVENKLETADAVWNSSNTNLKRLFGLLQENQHIDNTVFTNGKMTSSRLRVYSDAASVGTTNNVIGTYTITATYDGNNNLLTYKMVKI